jgi:hypothetical protein
MARFLGRIAEGVQTGLEVVGTTGGGEAGGEGVAESNWKVGGGLVRRRPCLYWSLRPGVAVAGSGRKSGSGGAAKSEGGLRVGWRIGMEVEVGSGCMSWFNMNWKPAIGAIPRAE